MIKEIGSEFHLETHVDYESTNQTTPEWKNADSVYIRSGREAIGYALDQITLKRKIALLPAYICSSMLQPFLVRGYQVKFFGVDRFLNPNLDEVEDALRFEPDVALYMDWFGLDRNAPLVSLVRSHSEELVLISDNTHNCFESASMVTADYSIASLRKWFALPDGAVVLSNRYPVKAQPRFEENPFVTMRRKAMMLKTEYLINGDPTTKNAYRKLLSEAESQIENPQKPLGISSFSRQAIERMDYKEMKQRRMANFRALALHLGYLSLFQGAAEEIGRLEAPFCFPILVKQGRDELQKELSSKGIYCPVLWPLPQEVSSAFSVETRLSNTILAIPCDHRYDISDMKFIVETINTYYG